MSLPPVAPPAPPFFRGALPPFWCPLLPLLLRLTSLVPRRSEWRPLLVGGATGVRARRVGAVGVVEVAVAVAVAVAMAVAVAVAVLAGVVEVAGVVEAVGVAWRAWVAVKVELAGVEVRVWLPKGLRLVVQLVEAEVLGLDSSSSRVGRRLSCHSNSLGHTKARCFYRLEDTFRAEFVEQARVPNCAEGASVGACESASRGAVPAEVLLTFTLESGASRCFFRDCTTVTPLLAPVPVSLVNPSFGPVVACGSSVLPCPAAPSSSFTGFHLPSFATKLVSMAHIQDLLVTTNTLGGERIANCTDTVTGDHLATFTRRPGSGLYTLHNESSQDLPVLRLHSDHGGKFASALVEDFSREEVITQSFTLPASPEQNGNAERCIGLIMEVARTSMIHAAAPHFLWPFVVRYAAHQLTYPALDGGAWRCVRVLDYPQVEPLSPLHLSPSGVSQVTPPPLVQPLEVSSNTSGLAMGGDRAADVTSASHSPPRLKTPPGFPPRPPSPTLQPVSVDLVNVVIE
ncbi:unnamed protein product [Closterium sp. NIES-54]